LPPAAACAALALWCAGVAAAASAAPGPASAAPGAASAAPAAPPAGHESRLAPFFARVRNAGRAEVQIERRAFDPAAAREHVTRGRVALEPPQRARVDFDGGEAVTLREDGGEWLQPQLRQLVRLSAARARSALGWCDLLIGPERGIVQRDLPDGRVLLVRRDEAESDSAWVTLDTRGLPEQLAFRAGADEAERVKLKGWSFRAPRGLAAFRLAPPHDFEVVELP
jgi:hypothetical protein